MIILIFIPVTFGDGGSILFGASAVGSMIHVPAKSFD
jgi:hypothetical protein